MSRRRKRSGEAPLPTSSAGLLRFYEAETASGIKIRPEFVIIFSVVLIVSVILARLIL